LILLKIFFGQMASLEATGSVPEATGFVPEAIDLYQKISLS
jgi:hypothetical protein